MKTLLTFEEYRAWCVTAPHESKGDPGGTLACRDTEYPLESDMDPCPVTVRSARGDCAVLTPRRSR